MLYTVLKQTASKVLDRRQEDSMEEKIYKIMRGAGALNIVCLLYTSPSPRDGATSRMPSSA